MKTITIKQPWASLIVEGIKDIENRTWSTNFRGRVLIHAGLDKKLTHMFPTSFMSTGQAMRIMQPDVDYRLLDDKWCIYGAIIGSVEIVDCVINHSSIWAERTAVRNKAGVMFIDSEKIYNWVLANPIKFLVPIPVKGRLSFWDYPNILAEPEEEGGELFCHCQLPIKETDQVMPFFDGKHKCRYCGGQWYK